MPAAEDETLRVTAEKVIAFSRGLRANGVPAWRRCVSGPGADDPRAVAEPNIRRPLRQIADREAAAEENPEDAQRPPPATPRAAAEPPLLTDPRPYRMVGSRSGGHEPSLAELLSGLPATGRPRRALLA